MFPTKINEPVPDVLATTDPGTTQQAVDPGCTVTFILGVSMNQDPVMPPLSFKYYGNPKEPIVLALCDMLALVLTG